MSDQEPNDANRIRLAEKYVWWKSPDDALADEPHFLAMLMTYGTLEDTQWMLEHYSADVLRRALRHAPAGVFNGRSWRYWHLRLGLDCGPMPRRALPA